jgi:hypothetical protein
MYFDEKQIMLQRPYSNGQTFPARFKTSIFIDKLGVKGRT